MIKHIVFMKFKKEVSPEAVTDIERSLNGLPSLIPEIKEYVFGRDIVRSERSYDFCLVSSFDDIESLKVYQVHPKHVAVSQKLRGMCDSLLVVDFVA